MTTRQRLGDVGWVILAGWGQIRTRVSDSFLCVWNAPTWVMSRRLSGIWMSAIALAITASG